MLDLGMLAFCNLAGRLHIAHKLPSRLIASSSDLSMCVSCLGHERSHIQRQLQQQHGLRNSSFVARRRSMSEFSSVSGFHYTLDFLTQISEFERAPTVANQNPNRGGAHKNDCGIRARSVPGYALDHSGMASLKSPRSHAPSCIHPLREAT